MGFRVSGGSPSYLYQASFGYVFRLRIPNDLREVVGRTEFRYSLRSGSLRVAKHRARCMASFVHNMFAKIRKAMAKYTPEKIIHLVKEGLDEIIHDQDGIESPPQIWSDGKTLITPSYATHPMGGACCLSSGLTN